MACPLHTRQTAAEKRRARFIGASNAAELNSPEQAPTPAGDPHVGLRAIRTKARLTHINAEPPNRLLRSSEQRRVPPIVGETHYSDDRMRDPCFTGSASEELAALRQCTRRPLRCCER